MDHFYSRLLRFYHRFGKDYNAQFAPLLEETGLSMGEMNLLLFLANNPGLDTARDVTEYRGIAKSQVSASVEQLSRQEILRRCPDASDRRVVHLALTEKGKQLARRAQKRQDESWEAAMSVLTPQEQAQLGAILEKLLAEETEGETT